MISKIKTYALGILAAIIGLLIALAAYFKAGKNKAQSEATEAKEEASAQAVVAKAQTQKVDRAVQAQNKAQAEAQKAQESVSSGRRNYFEDTKL